MSELTDLIKEINAQKLASKDTSELPSLSTPLNTNYITNFRNIDTGRDEKVTYGELTNAGVGQTIIKHRTGISFTFPLNTKTSLDSLHGTLLVNNSESGTALNSITPITGSGGQSRVFAKVIAGTDLVGTMTITGTSVDRDTGAETIGDTENIAINGLTIDATINDDGNGNQVYDYENAYVSSKWWKGSLTFSTTDLDISNIVFAQIGYEQFADSENIELKSFDTTYITSNTNAIMDFYMYSVVLDGNTAVIKKIAEQHQTTGDPEGHYRHKRSLSTMLNGATDGIFMDLYLKPDTLQYFSSFINKVWVDIPETINVIVDGSMALDNITYGETLIKGQLVYLKTDGKYWLADNTSESTCSTEIRLILEDGVADDEKLALAKGQYIGSAFTAGKEYVGTSGTITTSKPTGSNIVRIVSTAINATTRYFDPSKTWVVGDGTKINGIPIGSAASIIVPIGYAISDETSDLTTGLAKTTFRTPFAMSITDVRASLTIASTGSNIVFDINEEGVSILSTKLSIDSGEKTSETATTPPVISDANLADDAEITIDIDQVGSVVAGAGAKIYLIGTIA